MFGMPDTSTESLEVSGKPNQHALVMSNFVDAITTNSPLIAPAEDGLASLDLANAMLMSTWKNTQVSLPLDRAAYQQCLDEKIRTSKLRTKSSREAKVDMAASYR
jgi:hypothetical protein